MYIRKKFCEMGEGDAGNTEISETKGKKQRCFH
jgi:hypothetical protein